MRSHVRAWLTMAERARQRRALAQLSDRELRDIGITRYEIEFVLRQSRWRWKPSGLRRTPKEMLPQSGPEEHSRYNRARANDSGRQSPWWMEQRCAQFFSLLSRPWAFCWAARLCGKPMPPCPSARRQAPLRSSYKKWRMSADRTVALACRRSAWSSIKRPATSSQAGIDTANNRPGKQQAQAKARC